MEREHATVRKASYHTANAMPTSSEQNRRNAIAFYDLMDGRFVRGFFNTYYLAAIFTAGATAASYAFAGKWVFAAGATGLALLATLLRRTVVPRMDSLRTGIQVSETNAIPRFRRIHVTAILVNLAQLVLIVWSLIVLSMQMR